MIGRRTLVVFLAALAVFAVVGGSAAAGGGNSANAKLCQKSGWQSLETGTGGHFADTEDCTAYAAIGGALFNPTVTPVFEYCLGLGFGGQITWYAMYAFDVSGFHADSVVSFRLAGSAWSYPDLPVTDADGAATTAPSLFVYSPGESAALEATDAQGVDGSVHFIAATC